MATTNPLAKLRNNHLRDLLATRFIYGVLAFHCFASLKEWPVWFGTTPVNFRPVWIVSWLSTEQAPTLWIVTTCAGLVLSGMLASGLNARWLRLVATFCLLLHFSIEDSRDNIRHGEHALLWVCLVLCMIPSSSTKLSHRHKMLKHARVLGTAEAMVFLFYTMAGMIKVLTSVAQGMKGEKTLLHPDSGALIISEWLLRGDATSVCGRWLVEHRYVAWLGMLSSVCLEVFALLPLLWKAARPFVCTGLIGMHVGIGLSMDVWFPENVLLLAVFLSRQND